MADIKVNGVSLHYETRGTGPSVVLVHDSWVDGDSWSHVAPLLAERCTAVCYDRRGYGRSERPPTRGSVHTDVRDLASLIEALGLSPALVCGIGYGGLVTLRLAADHPDLVRGICAHEPPAVPLLLDSPETTPLMESFIEGLGRVRTQLEAGEYQGAAELFVESIAMGSGGWARLPAGVQETFVRNAPTFLEEVRDPDALIIDLPDLRTYAKPVLLTGSDDSPPVYAPIVDRLATAMPQAERHRFTGAGHFPHLTQPQEYAQVTLLRAQG